MNKKLQQKVKDKCKDMGLSEEYLNGITEVLGADIADDSTDEAAIETVANRISDIAKRSQGEATRWAQKQKPVPPTPPTPPTPPSTEEPEYFRSFRQSMETRLEAIEEENIALKAERTRQKRAAKIAAAFAKHNIPEFLREYVNVPDSVEDAKIEEFVGGMAQKFVTQQLPGMSDTGRKVASNEETKAAAEQFFKTHVTDKQEKK